MPRPSVGARLYIRRRRGRPATYVIRDGEREIGTGLGVGAPGAKAAAEAKLREHLARSHRADFGDGDPRRVPVADVLDLYGEKKSPTNRRPDVDDSAMLHLLNFFGADRIADVTPDRAGAYVTWRTAMPQARFKDPAADPGNARLDAEAMKALRGAIPRVGMSTARRELEVLSAAIGFAHREHKLTHTVVVRLPEKGQPRDRWLTRAEAARLVWSAYRGGARHLARFILIALYTGTRHEAVLQLKWLRAVDSGSVDLGAGLIYRRGSREADSSKRRPPVPISPRLAGHLRRWQLEAQRCGQVHVIAYGGDPVLRLRRSWNTARIAAGLGADVVPHVLRHTFATWAVQNGHSLAKVAAVLGTSERMIEQTYGHHAPDHLRDVVDFGARMQRRG